jgi:hypothetical protein
MARPGPRVGNDPFGHVTREQRVEDGQFGDGLPNLIAVPGGEQGTFIKWPISRDFTNELFVISKFSSCLPQRTKALEARCRACRFGEK